MTEKNKIEQIPIYGKDTTIKIKSFETLEEFNEYYKLHQEEIEKMTTKKLNKIYQIKDYKITRRKIGTNENKKLCFQLDKNNLLTKENDDFRIEELENSVNELKTSLKSLELENNKIKQQLIEIINVLNNSHS